MVFYLIYMEFIMTKMNIEVVFALPNNQYVLHVQLVKGSNVKDAIIQSNILSLCSDINLNKIKVGIYGRTVGLLDTVFDGDRVEIYRPLIANPRDLRHKRIKKLNK